MPAVGGRAAHCTMPHTGSGGMKADDSNVKKFPRTARYTITSWLPASCQKDGFALRNGLPDKAKPPVMQGKTGGFKTRNAKLLDTKPPV